MNQRTFINACRLIMGKAATAAVMLATLAVPAVAQAAPQPVLTRSPPVILGYGLMFVLMVFVIAISFMPSKRGHQD